jgi:pyruvate kinase
MVENPRPTRAEASDVANAIFDGTDAVMLSAETATGKYPREAVSIMSRIILEAESHMQDTVLRRRQHRRLSISETICESVAHAAQDLDMRAIAVYTETGTTARLISKYRPQCGIYAFASNRAVSSRMNLMWGVRPVLSDAHHDTEHMVLNAEKVLEKKNVVHSGDVVAIVAGTRSASGSTNFLRLHVVGDGQVVPRPEERRKSPRFKALSSERSCRSLRSTQQ